MTDKTCKHCGEPADPCPTVGHQCRVCKNGIYRYGMNRLDMIALHEAQDGLCAICEKPIKLFEGTKGAVIDHCHAEGDVRAILCHPCNIAVGRLEMHPDIPKLLEYVGFET